MHGMWDLEKARGKLAFGGDWSKLPDEYSEKEWHQNNENRPNKESKFDFLATRQRLVKI